jgi:hypothetical protein
MKRLPNDNGMWAYLDSLGILENGSDEEIKAAKRAYRKSYFKRYKRNQRIAKPEYVVNFSKENGELETVAKAAKWHRMTMTNFLRSAVLAYLHRTYLVPNRDEVAQLELLLSNCLNEIQTLVSVRTKHSWDSVQRWEQIELKIQKLEKQIGDLFRNPPILDDSQNQNK